MSEKCKSEGCSPTGTVRYQELSPTSSLRDVIAAFNDFTKHFSRKQCQQCSRLIDVEFVATANLEHMQDYINEHVKFMNACGKATKERIEAVEKLVGKV